MNSDRRRVSGCARDPRSAVSWHSKRHGVLRLDRGESPAHARSHARMAFLSLGVVPSAARANGRGTERCDEQHTNRAGACV